MPVTLETMMQKILKAEYTAELKPGFHLPYRRTA
jgi:hypothetical protein